MAISADVAPGQREKALRALSLHPQLQLRLWAGDHPLTRQDMAENFMAGWLPCHAYCKERERAASLIAKGNPLGEIRRAAEHGRPGPEMRMLYEWTDSRDRVIYVGITKDLRGRRRGHERFRTKPGMKMRMVGFGTMIDETALIYSRLLAGSPLLNTKMVPLRGLDVFCDCSAMRRPDMLIVGVATKNTPLDLQGVLRDEKKWIPNVVTQTMRWNDRIAGPQNWQTKTAYSRRWTARDIANHELGRACADEIQEWSLWKMLHPYSRRQTMDYWRIGAWHPEISAREVACAKCGQLGLCPGTWDRKIGDLVHLDPVCCGKIDDPYFHANDC